jgi:hypothetical protein
MSWFGVPRVKGKGVASAREAAGEELAVVGFLRAIRNTCVVVGVCLTVGVLCGRNGWAPVPSTTGQPCSCLLAIVDPQPTEIRPKRTTAPQRHHKALHSVESEISILKLIANISHSQTYATSAAWWW